MVWSCVSRHPSKGAIFNITEVIHKFTEVLLQWTVNQGRHPFLSGNCSWALLGRLVVSEWASIGEKHCAVLNRQIFVYILHALKVQNFTKNVWAHKGFCHPRIGFLMAKNSLVIKANRLKFGNLAMFNILVWGEFVNNMMPSVSNLIQVIWWRNLEDWEEKF